MGDKIKAGCGKRETSRAGYGIKISWWDRDVFISIVGILDSSEIVVGMRDLNSK